MIKSNYTFWQWWSSLVHTSPEKEAIIHVYPDYSFERITRQALYNDAIYYASVLKDKGVKENQVCSIIIRHKPEFYSIYLAIIFIGAVPSILAYPNERLHPDKFRAGLKGMAEKSGLDWLITEKELVTILEPLIKSTETTIKGIILPLETTDKNYELLSDDYNEKLKIDSKNILLLQHSSGTTGLQKPVELSHSVIINHVLVIKEYLKLTDEDKIISWLPLYHDMGLIGVLYLSMILGIPFVQVDPFDWVSNPVIYIELISKEKCTLSWLPNFAYNLMAQKIKQKEIINYNLSSIRYLINCSEPVRYESHEKFFNAFQSIGLKSSVFCRSYAMAETTLCISISTNNELSDYINIDSKKYIENNLTINTSDENIKKLVSSGKLIFGCTLKIVDDSGNELNDGQIGNILVKSDFMFNGYRNYPEKTKEVLIEGWYHTGDVGVIFEKEVFVIGRKKDIIIHAGKNIYPEDIEDIVNKIDEIIPGRCVALGEYDSEVGTEMISIIAESKIEIKEDKKKLKVKIIREVATADITIKNVYLVPPKWLIKSSSGKPSRSSNKIRITEEGIKWRI